MAYGSYVYSVKLMGSCFYNRKHSITALGFGVTRILITFQEVRPGLTIKRLNCQPTGTHPSPRSAWVWRSASRSSSLLSTRRQLLCIPWSQTGSIAVRQWVVTRGRSWLALRLPCRLGATRRGSMRPVPAPMLRQESASLEMTNEIATPVIPKLGLEMEGKLTIPTHVETTLSKDIHRTMEGEASKPWDISWCSRLLPYCTRKKWSNKRLFNYLCPVIETREVHSTEEVTYLPTIAKEWSKEWSTNTNGVLTNTVTDE